MKKALFSLIGGMVLVCMLFSAAYAVPKTVSSFNPENPDSEVVEYGRRL